MSYTVEERLSGAIIDLNTALAHLGRKDIEAATQTINEAIRKARHAKDAVKGMKLKCE